MLSKPNKNTWYYYSLIINHLSTKIFFHSLFMVLDYLITISQVIKTKPYLSPKYFYISIPYSISVWTSEIRNYLLIMLYVFIVINFAFYHFSRFITNETFKTFYVNISEVLWYRCFAYWIFDALVSVSPVYMYINMVVFSLWFYMFIHHFNTYRINKYSPFECVYNEFNSVMAMIHFIFKISLCLHEWFAEDGTEGSLGSKQKWIQFFQLVIVVSMWGYLLYSSIYKDSFAKKNKILKKIEICCVGTLCLVFWITSCFQEDYGIFYFTILTILDLIWVTVIMFMYKKTSRSFQSTTTESPDLHSQNPKSIYIEKYIAISEQYNEYMQQSEKEREVIYKNLNYDLRYLITWITNWSKTTHIDSTYLFDCILMLNKIERINQSNNHFLCNEINDLKNLYDSINEIFNWITTIIDEQCTNLQHILKLSAKIKVVSQPKNIKLISSRSTNYINVIFIVIFEKWFGWTILKENWLYEDLLNTFYDSDKYFILSYMQSSGEFNLEFSTHWLSKYKDKNFNNYIVNSDSIVKECFNQNNGSFLLILKDIDNQIQRNMSVYVNGEDWTSPYTNYEAIKMCTCIIPKWSGELSTMGENIVYLSGTYDFDDKILLLSTNIINEKLTIIGKSKKWEWDKMEYLLDKPSNLQEVYRKNSFLVYEVWNYNNWNKTKLENLSSNYEETKIENKNIFDNYWNDSVSQQSITSLSSHGFTFDTLRIKRQEKVNKLSATNRMYRTLKIAVFIVWLICIVTSIVIVILQLQQINNIIKVYQIFTMLRKWARTYYQLLSNILSWACIGDKESAKCTNYMNEYNIRFNKEHNWKVNFTEAWSFQNHWQEAELTSLLKELVSTLFKIEDHATQEILKKDSRYSLMIKNSVENTVLVQESNIPFNEALNNIINDFTIILQSEDYMTFPIYIFELLKGDFPNLFGEWNNIQKGYYNIMLNASMFLNNWFEVINQLDFKLKADVTYTRVFIIVILVWIFSLHVIVVWFVRKLLKVFAQGIALRLDKISNKMNNPEFLAYYKKKISYLKDWNEMHGNKKQTVLSLDNLKTTFKTIQSKKTPHKKQGDPHSEDTDSNQDHGTQHSTSRSLLATATTKAYHFSSKSLSLFTSFYINALRGLLLFFIMYFLAFFTLWSNVLGETHWAFYYINNSSYAEMTLTSNIAEWQMMIYGNQTWEDASIIFMEIPDEPWFLVTDTLDSLYMLIYLEQVRENSLSNIIKDNNLDWNCDTFYTETKDATLELINAEFNYSFYPDIISVCNKFNWFEKDNDYIVIYKEIVYGLRTNFLRIKQFNYSDWLSHLRRDDIFEIGIIMNFMYKPFQNYLMKYVIDIAIETIDRNLRVMTYIYVILSTATEIVVFMLIIILFFWKSKENDKDIKILNKVFK